MYCQKCSAENSEDAIYCDDCGALLKKPFQSPPSPAKSSPTAIRKVYVTPPTAAPPTAAPPTAAPVSSTNGLAIAALVLGLIAIAFYWLIFIGIPLGLLAAIFGMVAQSQIKSANGSQSGAGLAVAGIVLGAIAVLIPILLLGACAACIRSIPI